MSKNHKPVVAAAAWKPEQLQVTAAFELVLVRPGVNDRARGADFWCAQDGAKHTGELSARGTSYPREDVRLRLGSGT